MVWINLGESSLASLIAGLYTLYAVVDVNAIPPQLFVEIAGEVAKYLDEWDYDALSFEDWIKYNLMIFPKDVFTSDEIEAYKECNLFIERDYGNVTLIACSDFPLL